MSEQLVVLAVELLRGFGPDGASTEKFWPALMAKAPEIAPTDPLDRIMLLEAMSADIVERNGKMWVVFNDDGLQPEPEPV